MSDNVKHPSHYCKGGMECIDAIKAAVSDIVDPFEAYCTGNIIKYIWRWNDKGGTEDLNKAKQYADMIIAYHDNKDKPGTGNHVTDTSESGITTTGEPEAEKPKYNGLSDRELRLKICRKRGTKACYSDDPCPIGIRRKVGERCEGIQDFRRIAIEYLEGKE